MLTSPLRRFIPTWRGAGPVKLSTGITPAHEYPGAARRRGEDRMSDYMFMLESHLTGEQFQVVGQMQAAAASTGLSLYLTGGAMRDVLGGFPVRDLDFTVEGTPAKLVKVMTAKHGGTVVSTDEPKKSTQLRFEG